MSGFGPPADSASGAGDGCSTASATGEGDGDAVGDGAGVGEGLGLGEGEGVGVGGGVSDGVGGAVGGSGGGVCAGAGVGAGVDVGVGDGVTAVPVTRTLPDIDAPWMPQTYVYVPGSVKDVEYERFCQRRALSPVRPLVQRTVWGSAPRFVHVTVSPTDTVSCAGVNMKF